jgi:hypothetical protein
VNGAKKPFVKRFAVLGLQIPLNHP